MNYRHVVFILFILIGGIRIAHATVVINEVAWMGTTVSVNDEWIELYNPDSASVSLDGWTLNAADGSPIINLIGTIPAGGYYLVERTDDTTVPGITAGVIYSGSLSNIGETLVLKNNTGQVIDTVAMTSGWVAGNSDTKETMQKNGSGWITNTPTPGIQNMGISTGTSTTDPESSGTSVVISPPSKQKTEKEEWEDISKKVDPDSNYSVHMVIPDTIVAQVPSVFGSEVTKFNVLKDLTGKFEWSMGDGKSFVFEQSKQFTYTYQYPGTYIIMINYYSNVFKSKPDSVHKIKITVLAPSVTVAGNSINSDITLKNNSEGDIDLKDWNLKVSDSSFIFPVSTILSKDTSIIIPQIVHKLSNVHANNITLLTPAGFTIKSTHSVGPTFHSSYQSGNDDPAVETEEKNLFEEPQAASVIKLKKSESKDIYVWLVGFLALIMLLPAGFYILTNKLKSVE